MDVRSLRLFLAVLETGSITKASERVRIAQPALGLHIRKLEDELGVQLLDRHSRGVRATEAGGILAHHAELIVRQIDEARLELTKYATVPTGVIAIGMTPTAREVVAIPLMEHIQRELPTVKLRIKEALSEMLLEHLLDGRIDAALLYNTRDATDQLAFEPLAVENMYFVYPLRQGLREGQTISLADALKNPLILPTRPHLVRTDIDRLASSIDVEPEIVHEVDSMAAIRDFVSGGLGCSIMPRGALENAAYAHTIGKQMVVDPHVKRLLHLAYSRRRSVSRTLELALSAIRATIEAEMLRPDSQWQKVETTRYMPGPDPD